MEVGVREGSLGSLQKQRQSRARHDLSHFSPLSQPTAALMHHSGTAQDDNKDSPPDTLRKDGMGADTGVRCFKRSGESARSAAVGADTSLSEYSCCQPHVSLAPIPTVPPYMIMLTFLLMVTAFGAVLVPVRLRLLSGRPTSRKQSQLVASKHGHHAPGRSRSLIR